MAEKADLMSRDEEETQNNADEDPFQSCDAEAAPSSCLASPPLSGLHEGQGSSAVSEGPSVLSSLAMAQEEVPAGPECITRDKVQSRASGFPKDLSTDVNMSLGDSPHPMAVCNLEYGGISTPRPESLCWDGSQNLEGSQLPRASHSAQELQTVAALLGSKFGCCHAGSPDSCSGTEDDMVPFSLGQAVWMKTTKVMESLEKRKQEEKEKYRLQLAMYRRLLLLRSIRSLHKQLEQQQARLLECYGTVINTKKEVLKHISSASPSPSP
ncbi:UPF0500 protein C1orf216 homolog [Eudromia elegans]